MRIELVGSRRRRRRKLRPTGLASARRPIGLVGARRPLGVTGGRSFRTGTRRRVSLPSVRWVALPALVIVFVGLVYVAFALLRPVPGTTTFAAPRASSFGGRPPALAWPAQGEAAVGVGGAGLIGVHGSGRPTPIASIAKVMTAYVILEDHPLSGPAGGPQITVDPGDVAAYRADNAAGQSVVAVRAGERLTERQALEGLLLPSGNNIATLLARWDAGGQEAFVAKMNSQARALGLIHTRYTDASGVQPGTVSTAADQVALGVAVMALPAFRQTVAMTQATLPVAGLQYNLDKLVGRHGIVGIKTGTTSQAGGCFLFATQEQVAGRPVTVVGAVLHQLATSSQPSMITAAFNAATRLAYSTRGVLVTRKVITRGTPLGWVKAPWSDQVALVATRSASFVGWPGLPVHASVAIARLRPPVDTGQDAGTVVLASGRQRATVALVASAAIPDASFSWRLAHP